MRTLRTPALAKRALVGSFALLANTAYCQRTAAVSQNHGGNLPVHTIAAVAKQINWLAGNTVAIHATTVTYPAMIEESSTLMGESISYGESGIMILQIPPSPERGEFKLKISGRYTENIRVRIIDMKGKLIRRLGIKRNGSISFENNLNPGNYIIEVVQGNSRRIQKLIRK